MKYVSLLPAALLCCAGVPAWGACDNPPLVQIPGGEGMNGRQAEVQQEVSDYVAAMQVYTDCIKAELESAGGDAAPALTKSVLVRRNNLAVAEVQAVLRVFEAAVAASGAAGPPESGRRGR